jgi:hypothetical protein
MISIDYILSLYDYNSETGNFHRKSVRGGKLVGSIAGSKDSYGYLQIMIDGKQYLAHRLAWYVENGEWPSQEIDHIDFDRSNNSIKNLRLATRKANMHHLKGARSDSKTGVAGISKRPYGFIARIQDAGKRIELGCFKTIEEAKQAYEAARNSRNVFTAA